MSVRDNMGFALKIARVPKDTIRRRVTEAADLLELQNYLDRKPRALSGGQRQRVAMGRAIVREPSVFLMDEPLSNLDAKLRVETRASIAALQRRLGTSTVYVTHDQIEAMTMGDRVAVLRDGELQQCASPSVLYDSPANTFVAGFIGSPAMNLLDLPLTEHGVAFGDTSIPVSRRTRDSLAHDGARTITVGVRPEHFEPGLPDDGTGLAMRITLVEELGSDAYVHGTVRVADEEHSFVIRTEGRRALRNGSTVHVVPETDRVHLFHPVTGERLPG